MRRSPMSEEVVLGSELETGVLFTLYADSVMILLDKSGAQKLRDELNDFLGEDKHPIVTGLEFPAGCSEPGLPVGSKLIDNEGDIAIRVELGWQWRALDGMPLSNPTTYSWDEITDSDVHKWFRVVA